MSTLLRENKNGWENITDAENKAIFDFCEEYKNFIDEAKTERLAAKNAVKIAKSYGFEDLSKKETLSCGDKVYFINREKSVYLAVIGKEDITKGINFVIAHLDAPRIDIKSNPLYEDGEMALLKTHYYGGVRKYQWVSLPLSLIGVVFKKDGTKVDVNIGENNNDPVFYITDLAPHLAKNQAQKKMTEAVEGENLNIIIGSIAKDAEKDKFKTSVMEILNEKYGITEEDFLSAELEAVPNAKARDVGIDRSMIGAYAHDDRVCAYTALMALCNTENPEKTTACVLIDKEEIGSMGNTGMKSANFEFVTATLIAKSKGEYNELLKMTTFKNSCCLSADVTAAYDPNFPEVNDKLNVAFIGHGITVTKYTGSGGKYDTSDANAEFVSKVRRCFDENGVLWQTGELGKVDAGGGGTIAQYVANLDIDVLDCGTALLSLHAPVELASKLDIYMSYKAYCAFYCMK